MNDSIGPTEPPARRPKLKTHRSCPRPTFERVVLVLQGGGALGSYQGGVYQALDEAGLHPNWVAGISIGAINAALIAGNPPERRVEVLRTFWETITQPPVPMPLLDVIKVQDELTHSLVNQARAMGALLFGAPDFFTPRPSLPFFSLPGSAAALSFYDTAPLKALLERLVDFDRINRESGRDMRFSVGAVNVRSGNFIYFDNTTYAISATHVMASGALPPGFPAAEIEGEFYWDGGVVSNAPLQWVLDGHPRKDTLAFQVDLWNARGEFPRTLIEADLRQKEIRFSSRTRAGTDQFREVQIIRRAAARLLTQLPPELKQSREAAILAAQADEKVYNIIQLVYRTKNYEGSSKDYEFSRLTMEEHWAAGYNDAVRTLRHPEVLEHPSGSDGVFTFDLAYQGRE